MQNAIPASAAESSPPARVTAPRPDPFHQGPQVVVRSWQALWKTILPSLRFLLQAEVHVYSFAVAANVLLTFFPFLVLMIMICRSVLHWQAAVNVILQSVNYYFPDGFFSNIRGDLLHAALPAERRFGWVSILLLFFTANGIFLPLEVALNRIWHAKENRNVLKNQVVSLGLTFVCGILVLTSISLTAMNTRWVESTFGAGRLRPILQLLAFEVFSLPMTILMIFLIYWRLPNVRIPLKRIGFASVLVGILLESLKYVDILTWPWLHAKLKNEIPPFVESVSIILWAFMASMILLMGAEWSARVTVESLDHAAIPAPGVE
jgi:membrane protein